MSIRKRESKKHGITYQVYFNYIDVYTREKKQFSKSGFIDYEDALLYEKKKKLELNYEMNFIRKYKVTVNDVFHEWLELEADYKYQENSIIDYKKRYYLHIQPRLGNILIQKLDYKILQYYFNEYKERGLTTNHKLKEIINVIVNFAIKCNYITTNPMKHVFITGVNNKRKNSKLFTEDEFITIVKKLLKKPSDKRHAYIVALYIGKYTGLRISEVFALDKHDFDFETEVIYVDKKMIYADKTRKELTVTNKMKSKASISTLPFHKDLQIIMKDWFKHHKHRNVISDNKGCYLNPKQLEYTLWKVSNNLRISFNFHMLRHTLATKLVTSGADMKAIQELMRHASITTTMNIYTHINQEIKKDAL